ncbi:hypothetical protein D3C79_941910 [compost metagenome]
MSPPARLTFSFSLAMCLPVQQCSNSLAEALSTALRILKSVSDTRSEDAPPEELAVAEVAWVAPYS